MAKHIHRATIGLALILGVGMSGIASAQGMHGMMGSGMRDGGGHGGMMGDCPMMDGQFGMMHGGHGGESMSMQGRMGSMHGGMGTMKGIELNEEQKAQLRELRSQFRQEHFSRMAQMMDLRDEMHALMTSERPDPEEVQELHGRIADLHGESLAGRVRFRNQMQDLLTDEQREQMQGRKQQGGMPGGRGPGHGH